MLVIGFQSSPAKVGGRYWPWSELTAYLSPLTVPGQFSHSSNGVRLTPRTPRVKHGLLQVRATFHSTRGPSGSKYLSRPKAITARVRGCARR